MTEYHFAGFSFNAAGRDEEAPVLDSKVNWEIVQRPVKEKQQVAINQSWSWRAGATAHWTEAKIKAKQFLHNIDHTAETSLKAVQMRNDTGEKPAAPRWHTDLELELKG